MFFSNGDYVTLEKKELVNAINSDDHDSLNTIRGYAEKRKDGSLYITLGK